MRPGRLAQAGAAGLAAVLLLLAGFPSGSSERARPVITRHPPKAPPATPPQAVEPARPPAAASFGAALAEEYAEFVRRERQKRDGRFRADHFAAKARRAAAGGAVPPEDPAALGLAGPGRVALAEARSRLIAALERGARRRVPALAAKAQAKFDCWAERVRGRFAQSAALSCRDQHRALIALLERAVMPLPAGSRFTRALTREYLAYADHEARGRKDWISARHFARKGLRAAGAKEDDAVPPEPLGRWNLHSRRDVPTFAAYRDRLLGAFAGGARDRLPARAAVAQARFDCWVERTAGRARPDAVETCRRAFLAALEDLEGKARAARTVARNDRAATTAKRGPSRAQTAKRGPARAQTAKRAPSRAQSARRARAAEAARLARIAPAAGVWTIHFGFDQDRLRAGEHAKIAAAALAARAGRGTLVTVTGHADRVGAPDYNTGLSLRRATVVRGALIAAGVAPDRVRIFARGEGSGAAGDGAGHPHNRRVTIRLR